MKHYSLILFSICAFSCINDFQPKGLEGGLQIYVVNGIIYPDNVAKVYVGKSNLYNAPERDYEPLDADVFLSWEGPGELPQTEQLVLMDSFFVSETTMKTGVAYQLEVKTPEGHSLNAETKIPEAVPIASTKLLFPAGYIDTETIKGPFSRIFVNFQVPQNQTHYFETLIYNKDTSSTLDLGASYHILKTYNNDEAVLAEDLPSNYLHTFVFTTSPQQPESMELAFDVLGSTNPFFTEFYPVLISVSEDYFLYKKSLYGHLDALRFSDSFTTNDLYFPSIFKNIAPVYSNIEGGKGIFAGANRAEMKTVCNLEGSSCE